MELLLGTALSDFIVALNVYMMMEYTRDRMTMNSHRIFEYQYWISIILGIAN